METLGRLFSRKWWWVTILVILGMIGLARLGVWQLDRLEQRRAFNRLVIERWNQEPYDVAANGLPADLKELEWRRVEATGTWDYANQIARTNWPGPNGEAGVLLATPLQLDGDRAVLVVRGWVPQDLADPARWNETREPEGAPVIGLIQESETSGTATRTSDPRQWYSIDIPRLQEQMPYTLLPGFIKQLPEPNRTLDTYPSRQFDLTLDEGSHLSYAIQWFMFAAILGFGYIQFVRLQDKRERRVAQEQAEGIAAPPLDEPLPHEPLGGRP